MNNAHTSQEKSDFKRHALNRSAPFGPLPAEDIERLATMAKIVTLPAGMLLFMKGDPGDRLYIIVSGLVRIATVSPDGQEITLNLLSDGQMFGEIAILDGGIRTADATTVEETQLLAIERRDLTSLLVENPRVCMRLLYTCAARLRWISQALEDTQFLDLPARLAKRLLQLAHAFGRPAEQGIKIGIRLSQQDLATHMNASRESVNKLINAWEHQGLVQTGRNWIIITNPEGLEQSTFGWRC